jgi:hypothetical protein
MKRHDRETKNLQDVLTGHAVSVASVQAGYPCNNQVLRRLSWQLEDYIK